MISQEQLCRQFLVENFWSRLFKSSYGRNLREISKGEERRRRGRNEVDNSTVIN
jgi:hypothetical protein